MGKKLERARLADSSDNLHHLNYKTIALRHNTSETFLRQPGMKTYLRMFDLSC